MFMKEGAQRAMWPTLQGPHVLKAGEGSSCIQGKQATQARSSCVCKGTGAPCGPPCKAHACSKPVRDNHAFRGKRLSRPGPAACVEGGALRAMLLTLEDSHVLKAGEERSIKRVERKGHLCRAVHIAWAPHAGSSMESLDAQQPWRRHAHVDSHK
eukprot:1156236-Pelagomonas_calceolata.AAC.5